MDDVCVATGDSSEELKLHCQIVYEFLKTVEKYLYFLKVLKCQFEQDLVKFLGYIVKDRVAHIDPTKISSLKDWPCNLHAVKEVQQVLGILGYQ